MNKAVFSESEIAQIRPAGWLRRWLEIQKHGLTGHLEVAGFPFNSKLWACQAIPHKSGAPWWPYEQTAYWVDGFTRCAFLLEDPELIEKTQQQIDYVLKHADKDGYLGPKSCKERMSAGRWSHVIFFRAMIAYFYATGDKRIPTALEKHYLGHDADHSGHRDVCNIEIMCWTYAQTGNQKLLEMAETTFREFDRTADGPDADLKSCELRKDNPAKTHGVTFCETIKQGAILYIYTGRKKYLKVSTDGFRKLDHHHMLIDGVPSSHEDLRSRTPKDLHETCDIADYSWSAGYMLMASGNIDFADKIERACFNAAPGAVTKDFKALQYFSGPNQAVLANNSSHSAHAAGGKWMTYRPKPGTECCTGEVNRIMPCYASRMWMRKGADPVAMLYGPSSFTFKSRGQDVSITQETNFPFSEEINFLFNAAKPSEFTFWLRIPKWCKNAELLLNGESLKKKPKAGTLVSVSRRFTNSDRLSLRLPMSVNLLDWPGGGIAIERGPLIYSLPIEAEIKIDNDDPNQTREFPAYEMFPKSPWNYALCVEPRKIEKQVKIVFHEMTSTPWANPPISLQVPARRVKGWTLIKPKRINALKGILVDPARNIWSSQKIVLKGQFLMTPELPDQKSLQSKLAKKRETIKLVPYGCTTLRMTLFPKA